MNTTHMHLRTHTKPESLGQAGRWQSPYHDTMIDHDKNVGAAARRARRARARREHDRHLQHRQRPAHEHLARRRDDAVPQREEHQLGGRVPGSGDDPLAGQDPGGQRSPTRSSSTTTGCRRSWPRPASPTSSRSSRPGTQVGDKTFKVHIDGYNLLPYLTGEVDKSPRKGLIYFSDDGDVLGIRFDNWKVVFMEQRVPGHAADLGRAVHRAARAEAVQSAHRPVRARRHHLEHLLGLVHWTGCYLVLYGTAIVTQFLETFKKFPPRQEAATFTINHAVDELNEFLASRGG